MTTGDVGSSFVVSVSLIVGASVVGFVMRAKVVGSGVLVAIERGLVDVNGSIKVKPR